MEYIENKQIYKYYGHGAFSNIKTVHMTMFNFRKLQNIQLTEYEKKKRSYKCLLVKAVPFFNLRMTFSKSSTMP